jgi:hypothetical protein
MPSSTLHDSTRPAETREETLMDLTETLSLDPFGTMEMNGTRPKTVHRPTASQTSKTTENIEEGEDKRILINLVYKTYITDILNPEDDPVTFFAKHKDGPVKFIYLNKMKDDPNPNPYRLRMVSYNEIDKEYLFYILLR